MQVDRLLVSDLFLQKNIESEPERSKKGMGMVLCVTCTVCGLNGRADDIMRTKTIISYG